MTRRPLEAATTMTVTCDNLAEVPLVIRWMCANADAFKMISFQPVDLPFPAEIDHDGIEVLGSADVTPLADGIRASAAIYRDLLERGLLDPLTHGLDPV